MDADVSILIAESRGSSWSRELYRVSHQSDLELANEESWETTSTSKTDGSCGSMSS